VFAAESMSGIVPDLPKWIWIVVFLAVNTVINYIGISFTALVNRLFLAAELIFLVIFAVIAITAISRGTGGARFTTAPLFDAADFSPALVATALSIAVLSFLGFDGIATLSEEAKGGRRAAGVAMISGLLLVAALFVTQTWLAAMLVPDIESFTEDEAGNAFFTIVERVSSHGWGIAFLAMNALAVGIANAVAAQSATSRVLFSMSRDGRLPGFLSYVNPRTQVPERAILLVAGLTLVAGLFFVGQLSLISSLVNFGALTAFLLLHASVVSYYGLRQRSGNVFLHWVAPVIGFLDHRLRAVERRGQRQDRRGGVAGHRGGGAALLPRQGHRHPGRARVLRRRARVTTPRPRSGNEPVTTRARRAYSACEPGPEREPRAIASNGDANPRKD
jgi:amino acid transporter